MKGFGQKKGIDFKENFSPMVEISSIQFVLSLAVNLNLEAEHLVRWEDLHGAIWRVWREKQRVTSLHEEKEVWVEAKSKAVV